MGTDPPSPLALDDFLCAKTTTCCDRSDLNMFLAHTPRLASPSHLDNHYERKAEIYASIYPRIAAFPSRIKVFTWATIMGMPIEALENLLQNNVYALILCGDTIQSALRIFFDRTSFEEDMLSISVSSTPSCPRHRVVSNGVERAKCRIRDGNRCVITNTPFPQVGHIYPMSAKKRIDKTRSILYRLSFMLPETLIESLLRQLVETDLDNAYNMVALNAHLHLLWTKAMIGLQPIESLDDGRCVKVAVRLLDRPVDLALKDMQATPASVIKKSDIVLIHQDTHRSVQDGQIIEFREMKTEVGIIPPPSFEILQLQWALVQIGAMAGAGLGMRFHPQHDDSDTYEGVGVDLNGRVSSWMSDVEVACADSMYDPPQNQG